MIFSFILPPLFLALLASFVFPSFNDVSLLSFSYFISVQFRFVLISTDLFNTVVFVTCRVNAKRPFISNLGKENDFWHEFNISYRKQWTVC